MLASFIVSLRPLAPAPLRADVGEALHGLFYALVREGNAALAARLHTGSSARPFTISPLRGRFQRLDGQVVAVPEQSYWVRYTTLSDEVFAPLNATLSDKFVSQQAITLCGQSFEIGSIIFQPRVRTRWVRWTTLEDIWRSPLSSPTLTLYFHSATAFRQRGTSLLFPLPFNVFQSYREKWLSAGGQAIDENLLNWVEQNVVVEAHDLHTRYVLFNDFGLRGFVGWVRFVALAQDELRLKQINALADFAFFSGTGMKTTYGMGQTRKLTERPNGQQPRS